MVFTRIVIVWATIITTTLTSSIQTTSRNIELVEALRAIKNVQRQFAQLGQFGLHEQMASLFSLNGTLTWGNETMHGTSSILRHLVNSAGSMNGRSPGSLDTWIMETPLISLSVDGKLAKGRWNGLRFQGDGTGQSWIQGGIYENEYSLVDGKWMISELKYYPLYEGSYEDGWRNVGGRGLPIVPYHFSSDTSGEPIPSFDFRIGGDDAGLRAGDEMELADLTRRVQKLNDEDSVRNLMHAHGYYVDRRMWTDVVDLHSDDTTVILRGIANYTGKLGVRQALERMGPENLTTGINNDHPIFDMIVEISENGETAMARGIEIGMVGNANNNTAKWEFNVFRNHFVKEDGIWKVQTVDTTPLIVADYFKGWADGGLKAPNMHIPPFLDIKFSTFGTKLRVVTSTNTPPISPKTPQERLEDLRRRLLRSLTFDGTENQSAAYGYFLDDLDCARMGSLFAQQGHKASPFAGFYVTLRRISEACFASWGTNRSTLRSQISFHWRPQPVILVSKDGRSATLRARLLQPNTAIDKAGAFNSAIYHDQVVLETSNSTSLYRLWDVTIDEFYWESTSWEEGWTNPPVRNSSQLDPGPANWTKKYPPDLSLKDVGERESTFKGAGGWYLQWPQIQRMWFEYRNLVSGRLPEWYWSECVPCRARKDWSLESHGYQEPHPGPR